MKKPKLALVDFVNSHKSNHLHSVGLAGIVTEWEVINPEVYDDDTTAAATQFLNAKNEALLFVAHAGFLLPQHELLKILSNDQRPVIVVSDATNGALNFIADQSMTVFWLTKKKYSRIGNALWRIINSHSACEPSDLATKLHTALCDNNILLHPRVERRAWLAILLLAEKSLNSEPAQTDSPLKKFNWDAIRAHLTKPDQLEDFDILCQYAKGETVSRDAVIQVRDRAMQKIRL